MVFKHGNLRNRCFPNIQQSLGLCQLLPNNPIQHGDKRVQTDGKISDDLAVKRLRKYWWENGFKEGLPYWGLQEDPTPNTRRTQDWNHRQDGLEWTLRPGLALLWEELVRCTWWQ